MDLKRFLADDEDTEEKNKVKESRPAQFTFKNHQYTLIWDVGTPDLTPRCQKFLGVVEAANISQMSWETALTKFLESLTTQSQEGIAEFLMFPARRFISVRTTKSWEPFNKSYEVGLETGWYYYVTGVDLPEPEFISKLDRKFKAENPYQKALQAYHDLPRSQFSRQKSHQYRDAKRETSPAIAPDANYSWSQVTVWCVADGQNAHTFLIELKDPPRRILLDCGITSEDTAAWDFLKNHPPDWVIITHAHGDHAQGWTTIASLFPRATFICSQTTMAYLFFDFAKGRMQTKEEEFYRSFMNRAYCLSFGKTLNVGRNGRLKFLRAGHIPGAAAVYLTIAGHSFFYTGDFTWDACYPLAGLADDVAETFKEVAPDWVLADGSNAWRSRPPLPEIFKKLYMRARLSFDAGGSLAVTTDPGSLALVAFYKLFELGREAGDSFPIYMHPKVFTYMGIVNHYPKDLPPAFASQVMNRRNPFSSWRVQRLEDIQEYYEALSGPSAILNAQPFNQLFPLFALNEHNLLVFGYFANDEKTLELHEVTPPELELDTNLGGLSQVPVKVRVAPRYKTYNQEVDHFQLPTHPCKEEIERLKKSIKPGQLKFFHNRNKPLAPLNQLFP